jgi:hypothetical protein
MVGGVERSGAGVWRVRERFEEKEKQNRVVNGGGSGLRVEDD